MSIFILMLLGMVILGHGRAVTEENLLVKTSLGPIRGTIEKTVLGKKIYSFRGIRFGKAPINELRFQPPVPVESWTEVYNATENGPVCPQPEEPGVSEDCLFLNVFSTKLGNVKHPVFVFIHPTGFYFGSTVRGRPDYLLDQKVVLVNIQYRLGSLGFLSTGDHLAPGNNGLKDQVLAFKWIKNNIAAFGGDPDLVTIAGYNAGGASVSVHLVSPISKGLFNRAVIMGSSSFGNWPVPEHQLDLAQKQARLVGCPDDTSANIIKCLKTKPAMELADSLFSFIEFGNDPAMLWYPVIEKDFGQERFLTENPAVSVQCGKFEQVPVITSITTNEFASTALYILENSTLLQKLNDDFETVAPISFLYERGTEYSKHISKELKKFYFNGAPISNETKSGLENIFADGITGFTIHRANDLLAANNKKNVFSYRLDYHGRFSHMDIDGVSYGVSHFDDLLYIFHIPRFPRFNVSSPEYKIVTKLTTLLANFAKTGNPTPVSDLVLDNVIWQPYTLENKKYLDIAEKLSMKENLFKERYQVWDKLFPVPSCNIK